MKKLSKKNILPYVLWLIVLIMLILVSVFYFAVKNETSVSLFLGLSGVFAMLAIALQTFYEMNKSTKKTINTILNSSKKEVEEFSNFVKEIKKTNIVLDSVSKSLEIVSNDVISRQKQAPNLYVTFKESKNQIDLRTGEECEIAFYLHNSGSINATNPDWIVLLPPTIEIVDKGSFSVAPQGLGTRYPGYIGLLTDAPTIAAKRQIPNKVKIKTERVNAGLVEIPFSCSSDNVPANSDKLLINFIG